MKNSFEKNNFLVDCCYSFKEVKDNIKKIMPSHAIIDLKINNDSGIEVIKFLNDFNKNIKIVMLTGYASITTTILAIKSGASYYLAKPANTQMILQAFEGANLEEQNSQNKISNTKKTSIKNVEWEYIHQTLVENNFNITKSAEALNMNRRTLTRKLKKRGISF
jgi:two-component system response regulator RegA